MLPFNNCCPYQEECLLLGHDGAAKDNHPFSLIENNEA